MRLRPRAVALEEAARVVEDAPTYKGGLCLITTPQIASAIRALNIKEDATTLSNVPKP